MARKNDQPTEAADTASTTPTDKKSRLVLVFEGKYEGLYPAIIAAANEEDRDPDAVVLRVLQASYLGTNAALAEKQQSLPLA